MTSSRVMYAELCPAAVTGDQLKRHAELFSGHYRIWGDHGPKPGERVRASATRLRSDHLLDEDRCRLIRAWVMEGKEEMVVGHAFVYRYDIPGKGKVSWIPQLVVHSDYRYQGVAKKLCRMAWAVEDFYAAGLVSSHPYAVRALERATERSCDPATIMPAAHEILAHCDIEYVKGKTLCFEDGRCLIDTQFFVDHTGVNNILAQLNDWRLGPLEDGKEFFAFTFAASPKTLPQ